MDIKIKFQRFSILLGQLSIHFSFSAEPSNKRNPIPLGLNKKYDKVSFKRPKSEKKLPKVIDGEFIKEKLSKIKNIILINISVENFKIKIQHTFILIIFDNTICPYLIH